MKYLTIKKEFYDKIKNGEKTVEYRSTRSKQNLEFLSEQPRQVTLHYYQNNRLVCDIKSVRVVSTPEESRHFFGSEEKIIAIELSKVREVILEK